MLLTFWVLYLHFMAPNCFFCVHMLDVTNTWVCGVLTVCSCSSGSWHWHCKV